MVSFHFRLSAAFLIIAFSVDGKPRRRKLLLPSDANETLGLAEHRGSYAYQISSDAQPPPRELIATLFTETTKPRTDAHSQSDQTCPISAGGGRLEKRAIFSPHFEELASDLGPGLPSPTPKTSTPIPAPSRIQNPSANEDHTLAHTETPAPDLGHGLPGSENDQAAVRATPRDRLLTSKELSALKERQRKLKLVL